jgi:hypothetical protein
MAESSERTARTVLRASGGAVAALAIVLLLLMPAEPVRKNGPGFTSAVIGFELASEPVHVLDVLGHPEDAARADTVRRMDLGNWLDYGFMVAYSVLYVGIALLLVARAEAPGWLIPTTAVLALVMFAGDALENRELLTLSSLTDPAAMAEPLARLRAFTLAKWAALYAASGLVAVYVWRDRSAWRWSALFFGAAALIGATAMVWLPGIEYGSYPMAVAWLWTWIHALRA